MDILLAYSDAMPAAGMLNLKFNDAYSVEFAGDVAEFRAKNANKFLYWEAIKRACRGHFKVLGMTRTSADNTGLIAFKRAWGAAEIDLPCFTYPKSSEVTTGQGSNSKLYKVARKVISVCPGAPYKALGNFCYRHLG
jgi:lipid II:glycine glycyltransferase (peptidoglycan interpeptide bridge formation enzyme)